MFGMEAHMLRCECRYEEVAMIVSFFERIPHTGPQSAFLSGRNEILRQQLALGVEVVCGSLSCVLTNICTLYNTLHTCVNNIFTSRPFICPIRWVESCCLPASTSPKYPLKAFSPHGHAVGLRIAEKPDADLYAPHSRRYAVTAPWPPME